MLYIILALLAIAAVALVLILRAARSGKKAEFSGRSSIPEYKLAGIVGEEDAQWAIESVLNEADRLLTNVKLEFEGRPAELDFLIANYFGVFVIEVKNYRGSLVGGEDDYEWQKFKTTDAGNTYEKTVKNPIKQVRREVYLLANYLHHCGFDVWVTGYVILLNGNSPVESSFVLNSIEEIERAIHTPSKKTLDVKTVKGIVKLLR